MFNSKPELPTKEKIEELKARLENAKKNDGLLLIENPKELAIVKRLYNLNKEGIVETPEIKLEVETPEEKQLKNIAIALKGIQKELEHLNRSLRK